MSSIDNPAVSQSNARPDLATTRIGHRIFAWGERTFVMGIVNVTPDSFSGDGLLATPAGPPYISGPEPSADLDSAAARAAARARRMASDGADIVDVGGESTRPGHVPVDTATELARVVPAIAAIRASVPDLPISIDTTKPAVAEAALNAGADLVNDVWGVGHDDTLIRIVSERQVPVVLMHNREEPRYTNVMAEIVGDLERAIERALAVGVAWERIIVDPGFGFGKTAEHNLILLANIDWLGVLRRPILLGTSRKSTLGRVLDLPADERLEATLATTALGIAAGVDVVRVHDVRANVRAARMTDAIVRGGYAATGLWRPTRRDPGAGDAQEGSPPAGQAMQPVEPARRQG